MGPWAVAVALAFGLVAVIAPQLRIKTRWQEAQRLDAAAQHVGPPPSLGLWHGSAHWQASGARRASRTPGKADGRVCRPPARRRARAAASLEAERAHT